jgi:hypothetical protein
MRRFTWVSALVACAIAVTGADVRAQTINEISSTGSGITTCVAPTALTTTGAVVAIILLTRKDDTKTTKTTAGKSAELFLRHHHLQLAQDLATGEGPLFAELVRGLALRPENATTFGSLLRAHRKELLPYCDVTSLSTERALAFAQRVTTILETHDGIRADLMAVASANPIN